MADTTESSLQEKMREEKVGQEKDNIFAKTISNTLDKSVGQLDDLTAQKLKKARENALMKTPKKSNKWVSLSVAASVAILLMAPIAWQQHQSASITEQDFDVIAQDIPVDAQEMDDLEMLMAMGDSDA